MKINLKVTTECPANCICCKERLLNLKKISCKEKDIDELFNKILSIYKTIGDNENYLSITGGEPTLIENLSYYVKRMETHGIVVGIDTNGWNINQNWLEEMEKAGLKYVLFSVYSLEKNVYDYLRGTQDKSLFERMEKALCVLKKYKEDGGTIQIRLQTVLMKPNYRELPKLLEVAILSHFDSLSTAYYISHEPSENILMDQSDIEYFTRQICPEMISVIKKYNMNDILIKVNEQKIKSFFNIKEISLQEIAKGIYRKSECNCGENNRISIYPNGAVVPCLGFDYSMDESYALNIFDEKQYQVFIAERFKDFWKREYVLCPRCSSGYQVWLNLSY